MDWAELVAWYKSLGEVWQGVLFGASAMVTLGVFTLYLFHMGDRASKKLRKALSKFATRRGFRYMGVPIANDIPMFLVMHPDDKHEGAYRRHREGIEKLANAPVDLELDQEGKEAREAFFVVSQEYPGHCPKN